MAQIAGKTIDRQRQDFVELIESREILEFIDFTCAEWLSADELLTNLGFDSVDAGTHRVIPMVERISAALRVAKSEEEE